MFSIKRIVLPVSSLRVFFFIYKKKVHLSFGSREGSFDFRQWRLGHCTSSLCPLSSSTQVPLHHSPKPFFSLEELKRREETNVHSKRYLANQVVPPQDSGISLQTVLELGPHAPLFWSMYRRSFWRLVCIRNKIHLYCPFVVLTFPFLVGRYHSLVIEKDSFPSDELEVTAAWTEDGLVMAARHRKHKHIQGVQFHPESIIATEGKTIVRNFIKLVEKKEAEMLP
ncbi:unnamed protein product [Brassica oleracea var. botrytis]|uniref:(rape) hypothetical protein n=1 Tax=Brassica napus TaxID=3708 RepID=A0A816M371_BRANA|nr:unnamed protein product [Brassica napus]